MPKRYFYDTGLAVALLGLENESQLKLHPFRGNLFENLVVIEFMKQRFNKGKPNNLHFWRDNTGNEIDLLIEKEGQRIPLEIKSGQTVTNEFFRGILFWNRLTNSTEGYVIYDGDTVQKRSNEITAVPLKKLNSLF